MSAVGQRVTIIGIDPGPKESSIAELLCDGEIIRSWQFRDLENPKLLETFFGEMMPDVVAIEAAYVGRASGKEVGDTVYWFGRIHQAALNAFVDASVRVVPRQTVLASLGATRIYNANGDRMTNDAALRTRLIELYGGEIEMPKSSHQRAALAVALSVWREMQAATKEGAKNAKR